MNFNFSESARFAWRGVMANKPRSALTTLGVMIGVASVIILVAVGTGSSQSIQDSISSLGSNTLTVSSTTSGTGGRGGGGGGGGFGGGGGGGFPGFGGGSSDSTTDTGTKTRASGLSLADAQALTDAELAPDVLGVAPVVTASSVTATYSGASHSVGTTTGSSPAYLLINNDTVGKGRSFTDSEYNERARVVVVGTTVAEELAGGDGSGLLDQVIQLNGSSFTVVGILEEKGSTGPQDSDDRVIAPLTAVQDVLAGYGSLSSIRSRRRRRPPSVRRRARSSRSSTSVTAPRRPTATSR